MFVSVWHPVVVNMPVFWCTCGIQIAVYVGRIIPRKTVWGIILNRRILCRNRSWDVNWLIFGEWGGGGGGA